MKNLSVTHTYVTISSVENINICVEQYLSVHTVEVSGVQNNTELGVDRYVFFRADTDTDYYRSSRPITDILNRYTCLV